MVLLVPALAHKIQINRLKGDVLKKKKKAKIESSNSFCLVRWA